MTRHIEQRQKTLPDSERDWLSLGGAEDLARRIEAYWAAHAPPSGGAVRCRVEAAKFRARPNSTERVMGFVRSNLVGGLPPRRNTGLRLV